MSIAMPSAGWQHSASAASQPTPAPDPADRHRETDQEAFERIYRETHMRVRRYLASWARPVDSHLIDDAVADTYLKIWNAITRLREPGVHNVEAYVLVAARRSFLDQMRRGERSRTIPVPSNELPQLLTREPVHVDSTDELLSEQAIIDHLLRSLPARPREVLLLRMEGFTHVEIGKRLGISRTTVAVHLHRAYELGRRSLVEEEDSAAGRFAEQRTKDAEDFERASRKRNASQLYREGRELKERGDLEGAEACFWRADALGDKIALMEIAELREADGDTATAEKIYRRAHSAGESTATVKLARLRERAGDLGKAEQFYRQAAEHGDASALSVLARLRDKVGDHAGAESIARQAAERGTTAALSELAWRREQEGDLATAERLYREAVAHGDRSCRGALAHLRDLAGDRAEAEALARQAAGEGDTSVLRLLAKAREFAGDLAAAEAFFWEAVAAEDDKASIYEIVKLRAERGDLEGAAAAAKIAGGPANRTTAELLRRFAKPEDR